MITQFAAYAITGSWSGFWFAADLIHETTKRLRFGIPIQRLARRNFVQAG
jgi:uncharacterized membrane protein YsdA (DUF1294 family)